MTEQETKDWQTAVMKASLNFSTLCVELEHAACASGSLVCTFDQDETFSVMVKAAKESKLYSLNNIRFANRHARALLLYVMDVCLSSQECVPKADEPATKKRGRGAAAPSVPLSIPRMRAFYLNTPLTWDNVSTSRTVDAIVAFLE